MLPIVKDHISLPKGVALPCLAKQQRYRKVSACSECEDFRGFCHLLFQDDRTTPIHAGEVVDGREVTWAECYGVRCAHVVERRCTDMSVLEE